jgi:hypothetical protein
MNPAKRVIEAFGGPAKFADAIGRNVSRIHRWTYPEGRGGTGGAIPGGTKMLQTILDAAKVRGINLSLDDLVNADPDPSAEKVGRKRKRTGKSAVSAAAA